ncbi:MAG: Zn-ribbon domain-containing OB-fold protein [Vulcanisaeta sp. AZ3]|jgi:uncharacterized OB-fold protein|nr:MAG: DNA-binding protein [Vulcanisaeta sp. AZ3]
MVGGTPIKESEVKNYPHEEWTIPFQYNVTAGTAYSKFLEGLKNGKIYGTYCNKCGHVFVPPKMHCPYCFRAVDGWIEVKDEGTVITAVLSYISGTREPLKEPRAVGVIKLDVPGREFSEHRFPGIMHYLCVDPETVKSMRVFGMRVKARWKPTNQRVGSMLDIECFEPLG